VGIYFLKTRKFFKILHTSELEDVIDKKDSIIIVVDDDVALLNMLKNSLSLEGYRCETALSAASALELINKTPFDIMISDIVMSDMNGLELTKKAKELRPDMAVIITTGYIEDFSFDDAIEAGATDFIKKPFTLKELIARIKQTNLQREIRSLLLRDELTGIYNRRGFLTLAEHLLKIAKRQKKGMFMLYTDLDDLKQINDTLGHQEGDKALIDVANILKENYRESDIIARIGGDEFVVIPIAFEGDRVDIVLNRLQKALEIHNSTSNRKYKLSLSSGIAFYDPKYPCSIDELLAQADKSMYEHKKNQKKDT
jgi:two-component system, cell cycle response regulator